MTRLDPDAVRERLEALRRLAVVPKVEDLDKADAPRKVAMDAASVAARLEDLRELWRLTQVLQGGRENPR